MKVPGTSPGLPGRGAGRLRDDLRAPKSALGLLGRRFGPFWKRFWSTLETKFCFFVNFENENLI